MKKIIILFVVLVMGLVVTGGVCGNAAAKMIAGILEDKPVNFGKNYPVVRWCGNGLPFVEKLYTLLNDKTYVVLLQNNTELRSSGGFMGSFVKVRFENGGLKELHVQDIYQPDGQLPGHVEPPYPIQEAFGQGWWKLRDANWDTDFEKSGETVGWFLEQGGVKPVDGIVAVNLDLVKKWLGVLGEVESVTYGEKVTEENIYSLAQSHAEENWKPGSTKKRDFLGAVGVAMMEKTKVAKPGQMFKLAKLLWSELKSGQIVLWFKDESIQRIAEQRGWTGKLVRTADDYIYVVENNLGANKANCCIERKMQIRGIEDNDRVGQRIGVQWKNNNPSENPRPPESWGGNYIDYVRVVVGEEAENFEVEVQNKSLRVATSEDFKEPNSLRRGRSEEIFAVEEQEGFKTIGFWVVVPFGQTVEASINYDRKSTGRIGRIQVVRQPGIEGWPLTVTWGKELVFEGFLVEKERIFTSH